MPGFIDDGYTLEVTIPANGDASPVFDVTYRPLLRGDTRRLFIGSQEAERSGDNDRMIEWEMRIAESIAKAVKTWTLKDRVGKAVKITADAVRRMDPVQFEHLYNYVAGYALPTAPDAESEETADEKN